MADEKAVSHSPTISTGAVKLLRKFTGRGPTKARTVVNHGSVMVLFADTMTQGERTLVENGKAEQVLEARRAFQKIMRDDLVKLVETTLQRNVIAFMSDNHIDPDIGVEVFVLEPEAA